MHLTLFHEIQKIIKNDSYHVFIPSPSYILVMVCILCIEYLMKVLQTAQLKVLALLQLMLEGIR